MAPADRRVPRIAQRGSGVQVLESQLRGVFRHPAVEVDGELGRLLKRGGKLRDVGEFLDYAAGMALTDFVRRDL